MKIKEFPDTQEKPPETRVSLTRVGVTGVKKLIKIQRKNKRPIILLPEFNVYVNLPDYQKGAHMSRNPEAINEIIEDTITQPETQLESLCAKLVKHLLEKHEYAITAETEAKSEYMITKVSPVTKRKTQETTKIIAKAIATKNKDNTITVKKMIGAEVVGMTVCPCAQESTEQNTKDKLKEFLDDKTIEKVMNVVTSASHNQRGIGTILIEVPEKQDINVEDIINIIQDSMSSPVCEILKRPDENHIVTKAHENPVFVEDCVRNMIKKLIIKYPELPAESQLTIRQVNEESIHQHNAFAEKTTTMGELRKEMGAN
ncbi:MAG: GTP cyclohydrolase MptA [Methanobacteriaceae archaeon]|nr:GTP cyclohydrolase MptA [Methanobacteriaceae archaeon]